MLASEQAQHHPTKGPTNDNGHNNFITQIDQSACHGEFTTIDDRQNGHEQGNTHRVIEQRFAFEFDHQMMGCPHRAQNAFDAYRICGTQGRTQ